MAFNMAFGVLSRALGLLRHSFGVAPGALGVAARAFGFRLGACDFTLDARAFALVQFFAVMDCEAAHFAVCVAIVIAANDGDAPLVAVTAFEGLDSLGAIALVKLTANAHFEGAMIAIIETTVAV
jgi:hypothetical protein